MESAAFLEVIMMGAFLFPLMGAGIYKFRKKAGRPKAAPR